MTTTQPFYALAFARLRQEFRWALLLLLLGLVTLGGASCVSAQQDLALAPLVTRISTAGGGSEVEALAGIVRTRYKRADGPLSDWALRPLIKETLAENGDARARYLVPLGTWETTANRFLSQLLPLWRFERILDDEGRWKWSLILVPANYAAKDNTSRTAWTIFPFAGVLEHFLSFDRVEFVLFPLYLRTTRNGQVSTNILWPIFNWTYGPRGTSYRLWPLFGRLRQEGRFDKKFVLWPFFQWSHNHLSTPTPEWRWMFWPVVGHEQRGTFHAETFLWPFFGWSSDSKSGYWAWDGPWPLVRIIRPGKGNPNGPRRTRFWPFWSIYEGDGLKSQWVMFPFINWEESVDSLGKGTAQLVVPIWQHWQRLDNDGTRSSWSKLWPLYQDFKFGEQRRTAFPALNPLWHLPEIDEHYAWIYEFATREVDGPKVSDRSWGNIYRREKDPDEDRAYFSFLWSRRAYHSDHERLVEHSLLFGLLRWRTYPERSGLRLSPMLPAFPGPGWPNLRSPVTQP